MSDVKINADRDVSIFGDVVGRDKITINLPPPLPPTEAKDRANLLILLRKAKIFWIEGVLEKSLHNAVLLELGKETEPEAVEHPWGMVLELPDQTSQVLPSGTKIIDIFEKMNRAMLILGEPGSGKTITLLELARDLIIRAEADSTQPIPVVFNLSSWTGKGHRFRDWLVLELSTKYLIPKRIGRTWVKDNRILPLLDGLDEVASGNRDLCVEAINHSGETFGLPGLVVCCRVKEYTDLPVRLKLNGAICLQSLTPDQVNSYLETGSGKLDALRSALQKDEALQELAKLPLMLSTMSLAYQEMPEETLTVQTFEKIEDRRKHLFDIYISRMFKRKGKATQSYTTGQTISWLSWLAKNMRQHDQTIFLIEQLQPSWLLTRVQQRHYTIGNRLVGALIVWIVAGLISGISLSVFVDDFIAVGLGSDDYRLAIRALVGVLFGFLPAAIIFLFGRWIGEIGTLKEIKPIETLKWSWEKAGSGQKYGLIIGMYGTALWWMILTSLMGGDLNNYSLWLLQYGFYNILVTGISGGFVGSIIGGISGYMLNIKTTPNQGIRYSAKNAVIVGVLMWLIVIMLGLPEILVRRTAGIKYDRFSEFIYWGLWFGLIVGLIKGGAACIKHFTLRFLLYRNQYAPWNYARFLDHAASLIFLQKVGGGYIFIHRLLLEHFADMPLQSKTQKR